MRSFGCVEPAEVHPAAQACTVSLAVAFVLAGTAQPAGSLCLMPDPSGMDAAMRDWFGLFGWLFLSGALLYMSFLVLLPVVD